MSDLDFITVVMIVGIIASFSKANNKPKSQKKSAQSSSKPTVQKPEPVCDFCNDEQVYIGNAKVVCPKCKGAAHQ